MNKIMQNRKELWTIVLETAAIIVVCTLVFAGITKTAFSAVTNQTRTLPEISISQTVSGTSQPAIPAGYIKADYQVKLEQYSGQPEAQDISKEEAAELGAQDLWRVFGLDLDGKSIEMTYNAASSTNPRADWTGIVTISPNQSYFFSIDAVTGEHRNTHQEQFWDVDFNVGMDQSLLNNHSQYDALAITAAEKYRLVPGKVASVEYYGQGSSSNTAGAKNADIEMRVTSENGEQAQLCFSRYNQEFLGVDYDCWVKETTAMEKQMMERASTESSPTIIIDDEKMEGAQEKGGLWLKVIEQSK